MRPGQVSPFDYAALLDAKVTSTSALFGELSHPPITVVPSITSHFRLRAEFRIWHDGDDMYHIMFDPETKQKIRIDSFPVACERIANMMPVLIEALKSRPLLRYRLYQIDYLSSLSGELIISLIYKKPIPDTWLAEAQALKQELAMGQPLHFIGRARKQKILVDTDTLTERLQIGTDTLYYRQMENSFSQPNGDINQKMLLWARQVSAQLNGDLLELYCGNGNFSIALAPYFNTVVATELSKSSIKLAEENIQLNQINNVHVLQMAAEDVSHALAQGKQLKHLDLSHLNLNTLLVDPPRAGLDEASLAFAQQFNDIIYVSCNPVTLAANLQELCKTHRIEQFNFFDQFPYTHHIESGVWLRRITP